MLLQKGILLYGLEDEGTVVVCQFSGAPHDTAFSVAAFIFSPDSRH